MAKPLKIKQGILLSFSMIMLSSCSPSTWFLGSDNAPSPVELKLTTESSAINLVWSARIGGGLAKRFARLNLAQHGDTVYAMDIDGSVQALSLASGKQQWAISLDELKQGISYGNSKVFVSSQDGNLIALNATDGKIAWKKPSAGSVTSSASVANSTVIIQTLSGALQAFNTETGVNKWNYIFAKPSFSLTGGASPTIFNDEIIVSTDLGQIGILKLEDGSVIWGQTLEAEKGSTTVSRLLDIDAQPAIYDNILYVGQYNGIFAALDLKNKNIIWKKTLSVYSGLTVNEDAVYTVSSDGLILALNRLSGDEIWQKKDLFGRKLTRPILIKGNLVLGDYEGYVHIINAQNGSLLGSRKVADAAFLPDIESQGQAVILQDVAGMVYRVDIQ